VGRCEGYYRLENRRCDRDGERWLEGADGELYLACAYHRRAAARATVARWQGETDIRRSGATTLAHAEPRHALAWG
jgi:hypothetical protein